MSVEAMVWVLNDAPGLPSRLIPTLIALANHAHPDGSLSYPSRQSIARLARKSVRQVSDDLQELQELGLIRRGDQRHVTHLRSDRRPTVYDLALEVSMRQPRPVVDAAVLPMPARAKTAPPAKSAEPTLAGMPEPVKLPVPERVDAGVLVAEWIDHCKAKPPQRLIGQVARYVREMLGEEIDPRHVRTGLARWHEKTLAPSVLPTIVNEVMNGSGAGGRMNGHQRPDRVAAARAAKTPEAWL